MTVGIEEENNHLAEECHYLATLLLLDPKGLEEFKLDGIQPLAVSPIHLSSIPPTQPRGVEGYSVAYRAQRPFEEINNPRVSDGGAACGAEVNISVGPGGAVDVEKEACGEASDGAMDVSVVGGPVGAGGCLLVGPWPWAISVDELPAELGDDDVGVRRRLLPKSFGKILNHQSSVLITVGDEERLLVAVAPGLDPLWRDLPIMGTRQHHRQLAVAVRHERRGFCEQQQ